MSAPINAPAPAAQEAPKHPFAGLRCLICGHEDCVSLDLDDLKTFRCRECEDEFSIDTVEEVVKSWQKVAAWVEMAKSL